MVSIVVSWSKFQMGWRTGNYLLSYALSHNLHFCTGVLAIPLLPCALGAGQCWGLLFLTYLFVFYLWALSLSLPHLGHSSWLTPAPFLLPACTYI